MLFLAFVLFVALLWVRTFVVRAAMLEELRIADTDQMFGRYQSAIVRRTKVKVMYSTLGWVNATADFRKWIHNQFFTKGE